jgi:hypothetical protein
MNASPPESGFRKEEKFRAHGQAQAYFEEAGPVIVGVQRHRETLQRQANLTQQHGAARAWCAREGRIVVFAVDAAIAF